MPDNRPKQGSRKSSRTSWKPGQSGNPGGRPKVSAEVRELAREHGPKAIQRLVALMNSKNESVAVRASEAILDRGYGRPTQAMELAGKDGGPITHKEEPKKIDWSQLTDDEWKCVVRANRITRKLKEGADANKSAT